MDGSRASCRESCLGLARDSCSRVLVGYTDFTFSHRSSNRCPAPRPFGSTNLTFQLHSYDLERRFAGAFGQVAMSVHVLHRPGFRVDVLRPTIRVGELAMGIR